MIRRLVFGLALVGCGAGQAGPAEPEPETAAEIEIPEAAGSAREAEEKPPARAEPLPAPVEDPYRYYVGDWSGRVNDKLTTELAVTEGGTFHIHLPAHAHRPACDLWGRLRVSAERIHFDIQHSTCVAEVSGTTLERVILSKAPDELVVRSDDSTMMVRYTRKRK